MCDTLQPFQHLLPHVWCIKSSPTPSVSCGIHYSMSYTFCPMWDALHSLPLSHVGCITFSPIPSVLCEMHYIFSNTLCLMWDALHSLQPLLSHVGCITIHSLQHPMSHVRCITSHVGCNTFSSTPYAHVRCITFSPTPYVPCGMHYILSNTLCLLWDAFTFSPTTSFPCGINYIFLNTSRPMWDSLHSLLRLISQVWCITPPPIPSNTLQKNTVSSFGTPQKCLLYCTVYRLFIKNAAW